MKKLFATIILVTFAITSLNVSAFTKTFSVPDTTSLIGEENGQITFEFEELPSNNPTDEISKTEKIYKDEVLFGSGDFGHDDGTSEDASIGMVWSSVVDNSGNIYFIDGDISYRSTGTYYLTAYGRTSYAHENIEYGNQYLRKYTASTKEVSTLAKLNTLKLNIKGTDTQPAQRLSVYRGYKLVHDDKTDKVVMSGKFVKNGGKDTYKGVMFQVAPTLKPVVINDSFNYLFGSDDFAMFRDDGSITYSRVEGSNCFFVHRIKNTSKKVSPAGAWHMNDKLFATISNDSIYTLHLNVSTILQRFDMNDGTWKQVVKLGETQYDSAFATPDKFYISQNKNIEIMNLDGSIETFIPAEAIEVKNSVNKGSMTSFEILSNGNIIYYDGTNGTFRQISKK